MNFKGYFQKNNPTQIAAALSVGSMIKSATGNKTDDLKHFVYQGRKYRALVGKIHIPNLGERTALEICVDKDAQKYLVDAGCVGSVIEEIK